jgi:hypothetical protein
MNVPHQTTISNGRGILGSPGPRPNSQNSNNDRNNNTTPPGVVVRGPPPPILPNARRLSQPARSPPVGARLKDLPPGAAPLGTLPRPHVPSTTNSQAISVPLLASQLGRPVNLGDRGHPGPNPTGAGHGGGLPPFSPHHLNFLSHSLSPFAAIPAGHGRIIARNINGTCKCSSPKFTK